MAKIALHSGDGSSVLIILRFGILFGALIHYELYQMRRIPGLLVFRLYCIVLCLSAFRSDDEVIEWRYINLYRNMAISEMQRYGIPASIILAQALVESDAGRSVLAVRANNHFGIKCKSWWSGGKYYYADDDSDNSGRLAPSCFRIYDSPQASFEDHSIFLSASDRYTSLFTYGSQNYRAWAYGLQEDGYATDPNYASRIIRVIEKYRLYDLDVSTSSNE